MTDCGTPLISDYIIPMDILNSTSVNSTVTYKCKEGYSSSDLLVTKCYQNGTWFPNPRSFTCSSKSIDNIINTGGSVSIAVIVGSSLGAISGIVFLSILIIITISVMKKKGIYYNSTDIELDRWHVYECAGSFCVTHKPSGNEQIHMSNQV